MFFQILVAIPVIYLVKLFLQADNEPLLGVYAQPGKWFYFKKAAFWLMYQIRRWKNNRANKLADSEGRTVGYGVQSHDKMADMELLQELQGPMDTDAAYISAFHQDGTYFISRLGRRTNREMEIWFTVKIPGIGVLQHPKHPDTRLYNTNGRTFRGGGLEYEMIEPLRRWRVSYNGLMRVGIANSWENRSQDLVHVKISLIWDAYSGVFDFNTDMDAGCLADSIAREKWTDQFWNNLRSKHQTHYEQWGELRGRIKVKGQEERQVRLRGLRDHSYGVRNWRYFHRYLTHIGHLENGISFHVSAICIPAATSYLIAGYVFYPSGRKAAVSSADLNLSILGENSNPPDHYVFTFTAGELGYDRLNGTRKIDGRSYRTEVTAHTTATFLLQTDWDSVVYEKMSDYTVNGIKGCGIAEFNYRREGGCPLPKQVTFPLLTEPELLTQEDKQCLTLPFSKSACGSSLLVGGKGCQLSQLTAVSGELGAVVPRGICLTIAAYQLQLQQSEPLQQAIHRLNRIGCSQERKDFAAACEEVVGLFTNNDVCSRVQKAIVEALIAEFKGHHSDAMFAVRSSAAGEDGTDMSAAGQMETILGVKGLTKLFSAVTKCWASQFTFQAVEYRRQNGQPIKSVMGVVIQEMVQSEASGVLFTHDPLTGSPATMTLNANYGLGESVVSGMADPDTIIISRTWDDQVTISEKHIGGKKMQINVADGGGIIENTIEETAASVCCLTDDVILKLANIGIMLEKYYSDPRDIEWAVCGSQLYLLQARPITSLGQETEDDLIYEFDTPLSSDQELLTTANIGEMMPSAVCPLTVSTFFRAIEVFFQYTATACHVLPESLPYLNKFISIYANQGFINLTALEIMCEQNIALTDKKTAELSLMGQLCPEITYDMLTDYYGGKTPLLKRIYNGIAAIRTRNASYEKTKGWEEKLVNYSVGEKCNTALELYEEIDRKMPDYYQCWIDTANNTSRSAIWSFVLLSIFSQGKPEWTTEHYTDVAVLLAKCDNVYSAEVPTALKELAAVIARTRNTDKFVAMTTEAAVEWLKSPSSGGAGDKFAVFLKRHGHRCVREADLIERSWRSEPVKVVSVLQNMLRQPLVESVKPNSDTDEEVMKKLKTPLTTMGRMFVKWALPRARAAVGDREWGKSISIEMSDAFKQAYWKLAQMMVDEGRLPEKELLFFLMHHEIGQLLRERSAKLIVKSQKRRRALKKQKEFQFPLKNIGHPKAVEKSSEEDFVITSVALQGMPVSQGEVVAQARVVLTLQDANSIQPGEVLIVPYTDVGWSPYFPMISGLVTEIGGLLSHGAVVAREYGLPCVVGCARATVLFKTGDTVLLNGTKGTVQKVEE